MTKLFTVGHSNHDFEHFIEALHMNRIEAIYDVRSAPYSKYVKWACYNKIGELMEENGIVYEYLGRQLGGKRGIDYNKIAELPSFRAGLKRVIKDSAVRRIALLCAEEDPKKCHRDGLIAKSLLKFYPGELEIIHIRGNGNIEIAELEGDKLYLKL